MKDLEPAPKTPPGASRLRQEVILIRESLLVSLAKDAFTFGCILGALWFNVAYLGGHWIVTLTFCFCFFITSVGAVKRHTYTVDEAMQRLQALKARSAPEASSPEGSK
jgi:hypothetical protein